MNHKITFVKIAPDFEFAGVGFAGNIFIILNALTYLQNNEKLFVDMATNECVCTENKGENCWEYYFDQIKISKNENYFEMNSLIAAKIYYDDRNMFMDPKNFEWLKNRFYNSFKLKENINDQILEYYNKNIKSKKTLGVQVRLTDMKHYHNVSPIESYINKINSILNDHRDIEQIFLATDDSKIISTLQKNINLPIIYHENMFRADEKNLHLNPYDRFKSDRKNHRYILGIECLKEIFTLSKCDYMLKADVSSISIVACILSENIKKIYKL